jgi:hypothetical protein
VLANSNTIGMVNVVNRIGLDTLVFYPGDNPYFWESVEKAANAAAPMLEYLETSTSLRSVHLDVAHAVTSLDMDESKPRLEGHILLALAENSNVTSFASGNPNF